MSWNNPDGLYIEYGRDNARKTNEARYVKGYGATQEIHVKFDLTKIPAGTTDFTSDLDNDGTVDGFNDGDVFIPDQAHIESAEIYMTDEAAAGGTSVAAGLYQKDGSVIDADGLVTVTNGATANLSANAKQAGSGADVATSVTEKNYIALSTVGTFTAGKGTLVVKYTLPRSV